MTTRLETKGPVAVITVDKPESLNAMDADTVRELTGRFREAVDDQQARAVVVTGAGDKAFVAGADIDAMRTMEPDEARAFSQAGHELVETIEELPVPVVAAVNGFALGGGLELALACDLRIASERAQFGFPEVTIGVLPGFGGTQRATRVMGLGAGLDLILTGRRLDADEAHRLGLVSRVVDHGEVLAEALDTAKTLAGNAPVALDLAKSIARNGYETSLERGDRMETEAFAECFGTEDQTEGMEAFLEKREAEFQGR